MAEERTGLLQVNVFAVVLCFLAYSPFLWQGASSELTLTQETGEGRPARLGDEIVYKCSVTSSALLRWVVEPLIPKSDPIVFWPHDKTQEPEKTRGNFKATLIESIEASDGSHNMTSMLTITVGSEFKELERIQCRSSLDFGDVEGQVVIGFDSKVLSIFESQNVIAVLRIISGSIPPEDSRTVHVTSRSGTALGNGIDFKFTEADYTFTDTKTVHYVSVTIVADTLNEQMESFQLLASSSDAGVTIDPSSVDIRVSIREPTPPVPSQPQPKVSLTLETGRERPAQLGDEVIYKCRATSSDLLRWDIEPLVPKLDPLKFWPHDKTQEPEKTRGNFKATLIESVRASDGSHNMTSTLTITVGQEYREIKRVQCKITLDLGETDTKGEVVIGFDSKTLSISESQNLIAVLRIISGSIAAGESRTVHVTSRSGTALGGGVDFDFTQADYTFTDTKTVHYVSVTIVEDFINEQMESFQLLASSGDAGVTTGPNRVDIRIINKEPKDINECDTNNGGCSHICTDTEGSFICSCDSGYALASDGRSCNNINECETNNGGCSHICTDTEGSLRCSNSSGSTTVSVIITIIVMGAITIGIIIITRAAWRDTVIRTWTRFITFMKPIPVTVAQTQTDHLDVTTEGMTSKEIQSLKEQLKRRLEADGEQRQLLLEEKAKVDELQVLIKEKHSHSEQLEHDLAASHKELERQKSVNAETEGRYRKEMALRRKLHNELVELRGNIRVFCRVRPPIKEDGEATDVVVCCDKLDVGVMEVLKGKDWKRYEMDRVFGFQSSQKEVYAEVRPLIISCIDGYNVCIFAYGQTGSGKTYTMEGPRENPGLNQRALEELFAMVTKREGKWHYSISVSVMEIYNEKVRDLLSKDHLQSMEVREGKTGIFVPGLTEEAVSSLEEVNKVFDLGRQNRSTGETEMNIESSRSHALLCVTVKGENSSTREQTTGRLNLIDLAGSERVDKSGATGQRLQETKNINSSLSEFGNVIEALRSGSGHVPFRNSKLTFLLQDSLSGDSKILMVVQVAPVQKNCGETICSLNFAKRARAVKLGPAKRNTEKKGEYEPKTPTR